MKKVNKKASSTNDSNGKLMRGADVLVEAIIREGVDTIFAYPGGASIELHQALSRRTKDLRTILPRMEQGGGFMAHGYARSTRKPGVCMTTSGPGATNVVTCIADAYMDSIPLVVITGQVFQQFIGKAAFQETDFIGMTLPIVKHSYLVLDAEDIPRVVREAFYIATSGRPGPVVIDIPKDTHIKMFVPDWDQPMDLPGYHPDKKASDEELKKVLELIANSRRPVVYAGGGITLGHAHRDLRKFLEMTGLPWASTLGGLGTLPAEHEQSLYWFGMHGTVAGNFAVYESDLVICMGARFDDRITGAVDKFAPNATIVHIDIDASEHNKNKFVQYPVVSDVKYAIERLMELIKETKFKKPDLKAWFGEINTWKKDYGFPFTYTKREDVILPQEAIGMIYEETKGNAIVATGVGQHMMWTPQFYKINKPRTLLSSLGLGTMGFGLPAAIGAKAANPDELVINIDGDGSILMNIQELATAAVEDIAIKCVILNNQHLGMVMQWEDRFYGGNRGNTVLGHGDISTLGGPHNPDALYPDFVTIAKGFGIKARRVIKKEELLDAIKEMIAHKGPYLLDVVIPHNEHVLPFIPQGKSAREILVK